jgi:hypothetical protein
MTIIIHKIKFLKLCSHLRSTSHHHWKQNRNQKVNLQRKKNDDDDDDEFRSNEY